jgi:mono/diheme cytochrome c family protein
VKPLRWALTAVVALVVVGAGAFVAYAWRGEIAAVEPQPAQAYDAALVERGSKLVHIGNCITCHTRAGGEPFAGGLGVETPFGAVYSSNITPDPDTGIGRWSFEAFQRAMHEGVDRGGRHLYPAFPYDHFTKVTEDDNRSIFAFLMTRAPVSAATPANELAFPLNIRMLVAGWKLLYLDEGVYRDDPGQSPEWNRGAYLVEGLAHCGGCHTPRNTLGAEEKGWAYSGGHVEGWYAYAINANSPAPIPWDAAALEFYLRTGFHETHGVSRGPMAAVTANLANADDADLAAIATYVASLIGEATAEERQTADALLEEYGQPATGSRPASADSLALAASTPENVSASEGAAIYAGACATCHETARPVPHGGLHLALSTGIHASDPVNVINVVLAGLPQRPGEIGPLMPAFAPAMTDEQVAALLDYLRERFTDKPAWPDLVETVREARANGITTDVHANSGLRTASSE